MTSNQFQGNGDLVGNSQTITMSFENTGPTSAILSRNTFTNNAAPNNETVCVYNNVIATRTPRLALAGNTGLQPPRRSQNAMVPW